MTGRVYEVHEPNEERWFYTTESSGYSKTLAGDGEALTKLGHAHNWWEANEQCSAFAWLRPPKRTVVGYRLRDDFAPSDTYPALLTPAEASEKFREDDDMRLAMYEAEYETEEVPPEPIDATVIRLDGGPRPEELRGLRWYADLPWALSELTNVQHLFPGELRGFREALAERLDTLPGVDAYTHSGWKMYFKYALPPKSGRRKPRTGTRRLDLPAPPTVIRGDTLAEAWETWKRTLADYEAQVVEATKFRDCPTCGGSGVVEGETR